MIETTHAPSVSRKQIGGKLATHQDAHLSYLAIGSNRCHAVRTLVLGSANMLNMCGTIRSNQVTVLLFSEAVSYTHLVVAGQFATTNHTVQL